MPQKSPHHLVVEPVDFSCRTYFPGTEKHPFHHLNLAQEMLGKIPGFLYPVLLAGFVFWVSQHETKSIIFLVFSLLDWVLLALLPKLRISFGPPAFPTILLGLLRLPFLFLPLPMLVAFQIFGSVLVIYGFFIEPQFPKVEKYHIQIPTSEEAYQQPIRIIHLSDLHMAYLTRREWRIIEQVNRLRPDLILFSGDYFNLSNQRDPDTIADVVTFFNQLSANHGIFGVTGSPAVDLEESVHQVFSHSQIRLINNQSLVLTIHGHTLWLTGLYCSHQPAKDKRILGEILEGQTGSFPHILLYHSPDIAPEITDLPVVLQLSGHTHGGQVRLPFFGPLFTASLYGLKFNAGHYRINDLHDLLISRGIGLEGNAAPRVRFLSPPEVGLITLEFIEDNVQ